VYGIVRAASLLLATVLAVVYAGPAGKAFLHDALFLTGALGVSIVLGILRAPAAHFERSERPTPESYRVGLLAPVLICVLVQDGWVWAAACNVLAYVVAPGGLHRRAPLERVLTGSLRVPAWWAASLLLPPLRAAVAGPLSFATAGAFIGLAIGFMLLADLVWIDPLAALRQSRSLLRVWRRHVADAGSLAVVAAEAAWAYVAARIAAHEGGAMGLAMLLPLVLLAVVLARYARVNARLHRLSLSRAAVDAMLGANDPMPQVRSLLESIDPRITRESVEIAAFGRGGADRWSRVVRFGPPFAELEVERLGRRALLELQVTGEDTAFQNDSDADGSVSAYAARDEDGRLRGALLVFREPGTQPLVAARDFERAAHELGPLLGQYGAIAATRTAASIDVLTGLPNRRGITRALADAMAHVRHGGRYAVLLLDVDHFKSINDLLGHPAGDRCLAEIGRLLSESIRGVDMAGRFGGEEFLVLLRDASRERALQVAERLRSAIETAGLAYADGKPLTISVGVAYARAADGTNDVVERADRALYRAKNGGRNRVVESSLLAG
jgi:diguanylate cyclase (GGDEF)-like protein